MELAFETVYQFDVFDKIKAGKTVYMLDKEYRTIDIVNDLPIGNIAPILSKKDEAKRYDFWIERKEEENE